MATALGAPSTPTPENSSSGTFGSLRVRNYRLYLLGQGTSVAGTWMQNVAIGWLALLLSHSGVVLGVVTGIRYAPLLLLGPWGGLVADRVDNRRLITVTQAVQAGLSLLLAGLSLLGLASLPALVAIVASLGVVNVFDGPSRQIFISQLVERRLLANAIGLNSVATNTAKIIGPGIAGVVIARVGVTPCFFFNTASFVAVIVSLALMRPGEILSPEREVQAGGQIRQALHYIVTTPVLLYPLLMVAVTGLFTWEFPVSIPLIITASFRGGAQAYGAATACISLGAIGGAVVAARRRRLTVPSLAASAALWGLVVIVASLAPTLPIEFGALLFVGAGAISFNSSAKTLLQLEAAPTMRGRVMALWSIAWQGCSAVGAPIVGVVGGTIGARYGLMVGGIAALVVGAAVLVRRDRAVRAGPPSGGLEELTA